MNCPYCGDELEYIEYDMLQAETIWRCPDCGIVDTESGWGIAGAFDDSDMDDLPTPGQLADAGWDVEDV